MIFDLFQTPSRLLLMIQKEEVKVFFFSPSTGLQLLKVLPVDLETGPQDLQNLLQERPRISLSIFFDRDEEDFHQETEPTSLWWWDRYRWRHNKQETLVSDVLFSGCLRFNKKECLFVFVRQMPHFEPWAQVLLGSENPLEGFYVLSLEAVQLWRRLHSILSLTPSPWLFVIILENNGRMQHTVLNNGHFVLTRLLPPLSSSLLSEEISLREINATFRYLLKQSPEAKDQMDFLSLSHGVSPPLRSVASEGREWGLSFQKAGLLLGIPVCEEELLPLFLAHVVRTPKERLLRLEWTQKKNAYWQKKFKGKAWWLGIVCTTALWLGIGFLWHRVNSLSLSIVAQQAQVDVLQEQERGVTDAQPPVKVMQDMHQALQLEHQRQTTPHAPLAVLKRLAQMIPSDILFQQLSWRGEGGYDGPSSMTLSIQAMGKGGPVLGPNDLIAHLRKAFPNGVVTVCDRPASAASQETSETCLSFKITFAP